LDLPGGPVPHAWPITDGRDGNTVPPGVDTGGADETDDADEGEKEEEADVLPSSEYPELLLVEGNPWVWMVV
jgi:hypothetical protein